MKKILGLTIVALIVMGLVGGGTWAYFSDTETSTGNAFAAGTLDLKLDAGDINVVKFSVSNANPGQSGGATWALNNPGTLAGYIDLESISTAGGSENYDASTDDAESDADGDTSNNPELAANLAVVLFWDDGAGGGSANNATQDGTEATIYSGNLTSIAGNYEEDYLLSAANTTYISMTWSVATSVGNSIMGDSANLSLSFELGSETAQ